MQIVRNYLHSKDVKNNKEAVEIDVKFNKGSFEKYIKSNLLNFGITEGVILEKISLTKETFNNYFRDNCKNLFLNLKENEGFTVNDDNGIDVWLRRFSQDRYVLNITISFKDEENNVFTISCHSGRDEIERVINELIEE